MSLFNIFWHPHQKLWNVNLIRFLHKVSKNQKLKEKILAGVIFLDTVIWMLKTRFKHLFHSNDFQSKKFVLNYFDLGTHREANELLLFMNHVLPEFNCTCNVFAFEACPTFYEEAVKRVGNISDIKFFNVALCDLVPENGKIRLYYFGKDGLGNSIYRKNGQQYEDVRAMKLTDIIKEQNIPLEGAVNILRMNIEGAEFDVISDLRKHGLIRFFNGFYGMWDDVWKINPTKDIEFRRLLKKEKISSFPFNGRDLHNEFRKKVILDNLKRTISGAAKKIMKI